MKQTRKSRGNANERCIRLFCLRKDTLQKSSVDPRFVSEAEDIVLPLGRARVSHM